MLTFSIYETFYLTRKCTSKLCFSRKYLVNRYDDTCRTYFSYYKNAFFSGVVQNTYTNAEKLLAAAAELAQTGECNAEDIYSVAHELESHISSFAQR